MSEAHCNKLPQRKALGLVTHDNTGGPFVVECQGCGEVYPSFHCLGGGQIADTGDHEDARCPHCDQVDPHECDNAALAWNTQQLKINELQQRLTETDQQNDDLIELLAQAMPSIDYHASMKGEDGEHLYHLLSRIRAAIKPAPTVPSDPAARPAYRDPDFSMIGIERMPPMEYDEP